MRNSGPHGGFVIGMNNLKHFDSPNFEADVLNASEPVVVDFYADWCGPCRMMAPVVEQLAGEYAGKVTIGKLDVDANPDIQMRYGVMGIPTLGLFQDGKLVDRLVGYPGGAAPIKAWIDENVRQAAPVESAEKAAAS
jgi:thioredoxin 1